MRDLSGYDGASLCIEAGQRRLPHLLEQSQNPLPEAGRGLAEEAEASLSHLKVPARHRQDVRLAHTPQRF
jgi:hypothetical protein